jgi:beta-lactamase class A
VAGPSAPGARRHQRVHARGGQAFRLGRVLSHLGLLIGVALLLGTGNAPVVPGAAALATPSAAASTPVPTQGPTATPVLAPTMAAPIAAREVWAPRPRLPDGAETRMTDLAATPAVPTPAPTAAPVLPPPTPPDLSHGLPALVEQYAGLGLSQASVIIRDPQRGVVVEINPDVPMEAASLYKLFVLWRLQVELQAGQLSEDTKLVLGPATDRSEDDGYQLGAYGEWITVAAARRLMIAQSNNTAAWLLVRAVGWSALGATLRAHGFDGTAMTMATQTTTARDVDRFLAGVVAQDLDSMLQPEDYQLMLDLLAAQEVNTYLSAGFPPGAVFAHKTGALDNVMHDAGVLFLPDGRPVVITVMTEGEEAACLAFMEAVARLTWEALAASG